MFRTTVIFISMIFAVDAAAKFLFPPPAVSNGPLADGSFEVYWNVPTFMCHKYGFTFEQVSKDFRILQNDGDRFAGDRLVILYDPGMFPALIKGQNGDINKRNGGVPQKGNLSVHLEAFRETVLERIPDESFEGVAVIDFESWRPIFRQNWASLAPYRDLSVEIARQEHPAWDRKAVEAEAVEEFETSGRIFMEETLKTAMEIRPMANWSYYAYPYCFNETPNQRSSRCDPKMPLENDRLSWLFDLERILLPSMYLRLELDKRQRMGLIEGRIKEALRISRKSRIRQRILPYFWFKYQDKRDVYLSPADVEASIRKIAETGADGFIIWGSSEDVNTRAKCQKLQDYLTDVLGPVVLRLRTSSRADLDGDPQTETNDIADTTDQRRK